MNDKPVTAPPTGLARRVPGLVLFTHDPRNALRGDVVAGVSAFLVMIPAVLAYSELVGVPAVTGLYAALGAMTGYALFSRGIPVIVAFHELLDEVTTAHIDIRFAPASRPLREQLTRPGLTTHIGEERFFHAAWEAVEDWVSRFK